MKKTLIILLSALTVGTAVSAQTKMSKEAKLEQQIIALDKLAWEAWKNKNAEWFKTHTTEEFLSINSGDISDKAAVINSTPVDCNVKSYSLTDFRFVILNKKTVVLTYIATQDAVCGGKKIPGKVRASVTYVKRGKEWIEAFFMDTPIAQ